MLLKLQLDQSLCTGNIICKTILIDSEDANLIDCIKSVVGDDCCIAFQKYYGNTDLMNFECLFPYIISDGIIQWYVPFSEVTIRDFRITHNLGPDDTIYAEIDNYGGGGDEVSELISWIASNWDVIASGLGTVSSSITIVGFIHKIYKYFANNKNRLPYFRDVQEVVEKQDTWDSSVLMKLLKVNDAELMDCLAYSIGYRKNDNTYVKEPDVDGKTVSIEDDSDSIWGIQTCSSWTADITREIHRLNLLLSDLKFRSENIGLHWFHDMEHEVNKCIDRWEEYLGHGENLCFMKLHNPPLRYDRFTVERDINELVNNVQQLLDRITVLEDQSRDFLLNVSEVAILDSDEYNEPEEYDESDCGDEDNEIDYNISPWEIILTRLLLNSQLFEIITDNCARIAYVEQIYDNDVLLQVLSIDGTLIGYQNCNYYDIKIIKSDTKELTVLKEAAPKHIIPTLSAYGISAKSCILSNALENNLIVNVYFSDMSIPSVTGKVVEIENNIESFDDPLIKLQILSECNEACGNAWVEASSLETISLPVQLNRLDCMQL